jgi:hypothetical protein
MASIVESVIPSRRAARRVTIGEFVLPVPVPNHSLLEVDRDILIIRPDVVLWCENHGLEVPLVISSRRGLDTPEVELHFSDEDQVLLFKVRWF